MPILNFPFCLSNCHPARYARQRRRYGLYRHFPLRLAFLPPDLVKRLANRMPQTGAEICVAHDGSRIQPVFSLMSCALLPALKSINERLIEPALVALSIAQSRLGTSPSALSTLF